ncbi:hypothetical protein HanXRQr2_Chr15g0687991 [Helianthus annuus]|uniref:Uncharacterized protein n=1 Tax=Helianthus annuus TaxID=4232 RepID=A0A251S9D1_HELAN|nr:hypothetical protein HanXRQr2_Chr15g0687991 [Helianthus annuus]
MMQPTISSKNFKSLIPSISPIFKSLKSQYISSIQYPLILPSQRRTHPISLPFLFQLPITQLLSSLQSRVSFFCHTFLSSPSLIETPRFI